MLYKEMREQTLLLNQTNASAIREIYYSLAKVRKHVEGNVTYVN